MISFHLLRRLAFAGLAITGAPLFAADYTSTWVGGNDLWSAIPSWDTPGAPGVFPNNGTDTFDAILSNGGTITLDQDITIERFTLSSGTLTGGFNLTLNDDLTWTGGYMTGAGTTSVAGLASVIGGNDWKALGRALENTGTMTFSSADSSNLYFGTDPFSPGVLTNTDTGTFNVTAGGDFAQWHAPAGQTIHNAGIWNVSGAGTNSVVNGGIAFNNTGTVNVLGGGFYLSGGDSAVTTGAFQVAADAALGFGGSFTLGAAASITGAGTMNFYGGTSVIEGTYNITGTSYFTGGNVTFNTPVTTNFGYFSGGTVIFNGPVTTLGAGPLTISGGAVYFDSNNLTFSDINLSSSGTLGGSASLSATGNLTWTGGYMTGAGTTSVAGLASVIGGNDWKALGRALENTGTMTFSSADSSNLYFGTDPFSPGVLTNTDTGTFNVTAGGDFAQWHAPAGQTIHNAGIWNVSGAGTNSVVNGGIAFNNTGTVNVLGGGFYLSGGDSAVTTGAFQVAADAALGFGGSFTLGAAASITGAGTMNFYGGTSVIEGTYNITGTSYFTGGNVTFNTPVTTNFGYFSGGTVIFNGPVTSLSGSALNISGGTVVFNGPVTMPVAGPLNVSGGAIYFESTAPTITDLNLSGGTLGGAALLAATGNLAWTGGYMTGAGTTTVAGPASIISTSATKYLGRTLSNIGTMTYSSSDAGVIYFGPDQFSPGVLNNHGVFRVTAGGDFTPNWGQANHAINNAGTWNVSGVGTASSVGGGIAFHNTGTVNVLSGAMVLSGGDSGNTTGAFNASAGTGLYFNGGNFTLQSASSIGGAGVVVFSGGTAVVNGTYNVTGASFFTGATATFEAPVTSLGAGPLTVSGGAVYFNSTTPALGGINLSGGTLGGAGALTTAGNLDWSGGTMMGAGTTSVAGPASIISGSGGKTLGRVLTNTGTMTYSSSDGSTLTVGLDQVFSGTLNNQGTFRVSAGGDFAAGWLSSGNAINNAGIWNVSGVGTTSSVGGGIAFHNTGTVNVLSGVLVLGGGDSANTTGAFHVSAGSGLHFNGGSFALQPASSISGAGVAVFSGGTVVVNGTYNITGASFFTGATATFEAPVTSLGAGPLTVSGGAVYFNSTTPALGGINLSGGTLGGTGALTTAGNLDWSGGTMMGAGTTSVAGPVSSISGSGGKTLGRTLTNIGTMTYSSSDGSTLTVGLDQVFSGTLNNQGTFRVSAGGDFAAGWQSSGNAINNAGTWNVSGVGTVSTVGGGIAFHNTGTVNVFSGSLMLSGGDSANTTGAFHVSAGSGLHFNGGSFTLQPASSISGAGVIVFSAGTAVVQGDYDVTGASYFTGATATFDAPVTSLGAGPLTVSGGAVYFNSTTPALGGINLSGGTLGGTGALTTSGDLDWSGGTMSGTGTTSVAGLASSISGSGGKSLGRVLTNSGTMTYSSSDGHALTIGLDQFLPGTLNNQGTFRVSAGGDFVAGWQSSGNAINNAGIWNVSGPGTTSTVGGGIAFHNTGTVNVESGGLALNSGLQGNGGTVEVDFGAALFLGDVSAFTNATIVNAGATVISGSLNGATSTFTTQGGAGGGPGAITEFIGSSAAGQGTFITHAGDDASGANGGQVNFRDNANAGDGSFIANGFAGPAPGDGARITFSDNATAASGTLTANGGSGGGAGGALVFLGNATGGNARVRVFGNGRFDLSGRNAPGLSIGSLEGSGGVLLGANNLTVGANNLSTTLSGIISGAGGSLTKAGTGTLTLGGANTYTGATLVSEGRLVIDGDQSAATGPVTVNANASLGGSGIIGGAVNIAGTLGPGSSAGLLTFNSTLTLTPNATTTMEIGGLARGSQYDAVDVSGVATLGGTLRVQMLGGFLPAVGETFTVMTFGSHVGDFDGLLGMRIAPTIALEPRTLSGSVVLTAEARDAEAGDFDARWTAPVSDVWQQPVRWDTNPHIPNNTTTTFDAILDATGGPYTVTLGTDITIENLHLPSADATLVHTGGVLEIHHDLTVQAGTYSLQGGAIKGATIRQTGGNFIFTYNSGNRLDGATVIGNLNVNQPGGSWARLQNGASFTGDAHLGAPDGSQTVLAYDQTSTLGGTIHMDSEGPNDVTIEGTHTLTVGPSGVIRGRGKIGDQFHIGGTNALINQGLISADIAGRALRVVGASLTNLGTVEAINGAMLNVESASFTNLGVFKAASGGSLDLYGTTTVAGLGTLTNLGGAINLRGDMDNTGGANALNVTAGQATLNGGRFFGGGTINATAGLRFGNNGTNRLDGVTLNGVLNLNETGGSWLRLQNSAAFTGNANLGTPDGSISVLAFEQNGTLAGVTVNMDGIAPNTYLTIEGTNTLTVGATGIVRGQGVIGNQFHVGGAHALVNQGLISADLPNRTLSLQASTFTNAGVFEAKNDAILSVPNGYTQTGGSTRLNDGILNSPLIDLVAGNIEGLGVINANITSTAGIFDLDVGTAINGAVNATGGAWTGQGAVNGTVAINAGTFTIGSSANLTTAAGISVSGSGSIAASDTTAKITGSVSYASSSASTFAGAIVGAGNALTLENAAAVLTLAGPSTYNGATTLNAGTLRAGIASIPDVSGAFGNNSAVILADAASVTLDLAGFDTQIGSLTGGGASGGNVNLGNATLTVGGDDTSPAPYAGTISGSGEFRKVGVGTQTLTSVQAYTGTTTVNAGTLRLDFASLPTPANLLDPASGLTLGGGTLSVRGQTGAGVLTTQTLADLVLTADSASTIFLDPNNSDTGGTTLILGNVWTRQTGASLLFDYSSTSTGERIVKTTGPVTGSGAQSHGIFGYALVEDAGGIGFATQDASFQIVRSTAVGTVLLSDNSTALTTAIDFTTVTTDPDYSSIGGTLTLDNVPHAANTLTIDTTGGGTLDLGGANGVLSLTSGAIMVKGGDDYSIEDGALGASGSEVVIHQTGTGMLTVASPISGGAGSLTKDGSGALTLTGTQNYAVLTTNGGTTNLEVALGTGSSTLHANAMTKLATSQTLAAIEIGAGGSVISGNAAPAFAEAATFAAPVTVPEPSACGLIGIGALLLGLRRKTARRV